MFIPDSRVHKYILHGKKMYTLHVISLKFVGKSPQTLQGKRRNSYNQNYLQWAQTFYVILLNTLYSRSKRILKSNKRNSSLHVTMSIANFTQTNFAPSQIRYPTSSLILISFRSSNRLRYRIVTLKEAKVGKVEALSSSSDVCRFLVQMQTQLLRAMGSNYF